MSSGMNLYQKRGNSGHVVIHLLVALFGISAWIGVNGIFVQLPILLNSSPEGWTLPSYVVIVIQSANIGPAIYSILAYFQCKLKESQCILSVLMSGTIAMGLVAYFYDTRTVIGGTERSLALLILVFFTALVGCSSSVLFMPYLRNFKEVYMISYFIGEGLSGVIPSIVALIQGVSNIDCILTANNTLQQVTLKPKFPPRDYFIFIFAILLLSFIAFIILEYSSFVQSKKNYCISEIIMQDTNVHVQNDKFRNEWISGNSNKDNENNKNISYKNQNNIETTLNQNYVVSTLNKFHLFILMTLFCFLSHGFLPSIQSYSCLPYGNIAYQLSITLAQLANPIACALALWIMPTSLKIVNYLSAISLIIACYVTYVAIMSPTPPLQYLTIGLVLVVVSWTIVIGLISYLKLVIVSMFRQMPTSKMLFYVGIIMQTGSAIGAIFSFILISFTNIFKVHDPCASVTEYNFQT